MNILIIKPSSLGDIIHAQPFLSGLKELYPSATISWLLNSEYVELLKENPHIDEVIAFDRKLWKTCKIKASSYFLSLILNLRRKQFDMVIDLQGLFRSGLISFLTGSKKRIGLKDAREGSRLFYTDCLGTSKKDIHAVDKLLAILKDLKWQKREVTLADFTLYIPESVDQKVKKMLKPVHGKKIIVISPLTRWKTKLWDPQKYITLIDSLMDRDNIAIILIGSHQDQYITEQIANHVSSNVLNFSGKTTLLELVSLLKQSDLLISSDSGPIHVANAVGCKTITLFGPTSPIRTGAYLKGDTVVTKNKSCAPCYLKECKEISCMKEIEPKDLLPHI